MLDPTPVSEADYLIVESTYGDRLHDRRPVEPALADLLERALGRGGVVVIPTFAVGRAQSLLYHLERLKSAGQLADVPIYLDSPMAIEASAALEQFPEDRRLGDMEWRRACEVAEYVETAERSKEIFADARPKIILSASGMATGGRVLHHLRNYAPDARNLILFAGYQAAGTRGASLVGGADTIKIFGEYVQVRAQVENLDMLSAHADADEIMRWLHNFNHPPRVSFIVHGEPSAADALRLRIQDELGWRCQTPEYGDGADL